MAMPSPLSAINISKKRGWPITEKLSEPPLGMALTARNLSDGEIVRNVVLFAVLVYELVGPTFTKWALLRAGEIKREGKSNARTPNLEDNKPGITIK